MKDGTPAGGEQIAHCCVYHVVMADEANADGLLSDSVPNWDDKHELLFHQLRQLKALYERDKKKREITTEKKYEEIQLQHHKDKFTLWKEWLQQNPLYSWQKDALAIWSEKTYKGTIKVATGGGKTRFALAAIGRLHERISGQFKVVIIVPTIPLMYQWRDELKKCELPSDSIGLMGGGNAADGNKIDILIVVLASARDKLSSFVNNFNWGNNIFLIVDECHRIAAEESRKILNIKTEWSLGLSATPESNYGTGSLSSDDQYNQGDVGRKLGPIIFDYSLAQARNDDLLTPFEVWHVGVPLSPGELERHNILSRQISELRRELQKRHRQSKSSLDLVAWAQSTSRRGGEGGEDCARFISLAGDRKRLLYRAENRVKAACDILKKASEDPKTQSILFHEVIEEVDRIWIILNKEKLAIVREHSGEKQEDRDTSIDLFRRGVAKIIISARSLVEGFNVPSADVGVIAASSGSVRQRIQSLGRMLRRKDSGRAARIWVLYVRDTEDESIYEQADWETIIGAESNKYFHWKPELGSVVEGEAREQLSTAPRKYRPPCGEIIASDLKPGDAYHAQVRGDDLKLDHVGNLRDGNGALVRIDPEGLGKIRELRPDGRAVINACGHVIARKPAVGSAQGHDDDWIFVGLRLPDVTGQLAATHTIKIVQNRGARRLAIVVRRETKWVLEDDTCRALLGWIASEEPSLGSSVDRVFWNQDHRRYWIEISGERRNYEGELANLIVPN